MREAYVIVKNSFYMSDCPPIINESLRNSQHRFHNCCGMGDSTNNNSQFFAFQLVCYVKLRMWLKKN